MIEAAGAPAPDVANAVVPSGAEHIRNRKDARNLEYPPLPEPLRIGVYDNHTHFDIADGDIPLTVLEQLERATASGVIGVVQVGIDVETSRWSAALAAREPRVLAAVAIHPNEAPIMAEAGTLDDGLEAIDELAAQPRVRAIGETGLDFFRTGEAGRPEQLRSFEAHIDIAKRHGLAVQIHDRDAHDEVVETLLRVGAPKSTVFHCFSGGVELAKTAATEGWFLSFAGTVTFKNAVNLREALDVIPLSQILVETDSPFLTPAPFRGRPNASYLVPHTVRYIAEYLGFDLDEFCAIVASNTESVYGSWNDGLRNDSSQRTLV